MGCGPSKDSVKAITTGEDGQIRSKSASKVKVKSAKESAVNESAATIVGATKSTSAKSRDSGIQEMDYESGDIITENSDPNRVQEVEADGRPETPGRQLTSKSAGRERIKSRAILQELEAEGLITGSKVQKGGAAFEVRAGPLQPLEPLAPIRRPPPRLEKLKRESSTLTKADLEQKLKAAEERRKKNLEKKTSRLAMQLARDRELANKFEADNATLEFEKQLSTDPFNQGRGERTDAIENPLTKKTIFDEASLSSLEDGDAKPSDDFYTNTVNSNSQIFD
uniref:Stathmin domain-containing protein 1 n=1 Tax=Ciona intestinalis TaxID=7719 RepID=F7AT31_CIOIN|nr:stathmin domain-containing protein 1 isoform X2 [Ciona intestinalis]XP_026691124.1 stathmin domain-containing protein 1 isoform X2 [Ciona intestinalis]XP_026691131.1 stathmin domain-containing protein 1 isoform X2 [Ciona intestinalis]XP_026691134.1 stathmin domain-containing protein 1 isoform X2 [Ciona intestinalis]|eukprot:XP_026691114.1 stathmin domain-containing protein 1 isoform X2 [Ciona intestinalis]